MIDHLLQTMAAEGGVSAGTPKEIERAAQRMEDQAWHAGQTARGDLDAACQFTHPYLRKVWATARGESK